MIQTARGMSGLQSRRNAVERYIRGYRDAVDWMYSDPAALKTYAEFAGISEPMAKRIRDRFVRL